MGKNVENVVNEVKSASLDDVLENVREELRIQMLQRELAKRELEFLENGGDPVDYDVRHVSFVRGQSTSITSQHEEQVFTSNTLIEQHTLQLRETVCDTNTEDNILLSDEKNQAADVETNYKNPNIIRHVVLSEQSSQVEETLDESTIIRPYARRNRSKPNHDSSRSALTDVVPPQDSVDVPLPSHFGVKGANGSVFYYNHINEKKSSNLVEKSERLNPDLTPMVTDVSNIGSKCSSSVDTAEGLPKGNSEECLLPVLASVAPQVQLVEVNRTMNYESPEVIVGKAGLLNNGCVHDDNTTKNAEGNAIVVKTASPCVHGNRHGEAENNASTTPVKSSNSEYSSQDDLNGGNACPIMENVVPEHNLTKNYEITEKIMIDNANECEDGQIFLDGENSDLRNTNSNKIEAIVSELSEMDKKLHADTRISTVSSGTESNNHVVSGIGSVHENVSASDATPEIGSSATAETMVHEISHANSFSKSSVDASNPEISRTKEQQNADEDTLLAEALLIEEKRKRISQLLLGTKHLEKRPKTQWDFVLEEMEWLANDVTQERLWKISAAAQFGHYTALASRQRVAKIMPNIKIKEVAQFTAMAVLRFWQSVESSIYTEVIKTSDSEKPLNTNDAANQTEDSKVLQEPKTEVVKHTLINNHAIREYAIRFLKYNAAVIPDFYPDAQLSPGFKRSLVTNEDGNILKSYLTHDILFYKVPAGAMESYRNAIESHELQYEVSGGGLQKAERSLYDDTGGEEHDTCYLPSAFEGSQASKPAQKKRKNLSNEYASGMYDVKIDDGYYARPSPKKRSCTTSQQRLPSPCGVEIDGDWELSDRTDASSNDSDSYQDDHIEYSTKIERHVLRDVEVGLSKSKKKKNPKHLNLPHKHRWQQKTPHPDGQRDVFNKKACIQPLKHSRVDGLIGQPNVKKPIQTSDRSFREVKDVTSQINNMLHPSQIMRMIGVGNQARKAKSSKGTSGKSGSGNLWSSFEDQALVVLVHDLGPNWNLVSDAMNSSLHFLFIYRKPDECMERHQILMEKTTDDGADSAEDSVTSQPYSSTLPGIPKGSARQLFQRLQGPIEENTLKKHFEKIISIRRKQHHQKNWKEVHNHNQVFPIHHSHADALSEVSSYYKNGSYPSPLDLCDVPFSNLDSVTLGNEDTHSELQIPPGNKSSYQGTPSLLTGSNLPHVRTSNPSPPINEQHKFNPMSTQQASLSVSGTKSVTDQNTVRTVPDANSSGVMGGLSSQVSRLKSEETNGSPTPIARGITSFGTIGMQNHVNPRVNSSQGTSTSNFSGTYTILNQESQRQMIAQANNQGTTQIHPTHNQLQQKMPPYQSHGLNHHPRVRGPNVLQHPAYAHLVKEQKLQQKPLTQQQSSAQIPNRSISQSPMLSQATPLPPVRPLSSPVTPTSQPQYLLPQGFNPSQNGSSVVVNQNSRKGRQSSNPVRPRPPHRPQQVETQQLAKFSNGGVPANISTSQSGTHDSSHPRKVAPPVLGLPAEQLASVYGGVVQSLRPQAHQSFGHTLQQKRFHSTVRPMNPVQHQQAPPTSDNGSRNKILDRISAPKSSILHAAKSSEAASGDLQLHKKLKLLPKNRSEIPDNMEKDKQQNHHRNTDKKSKNTIDPDRLAEHVMNSTPASTQAALSHVTGSTGDTSMKSSSSILPRTELGLYDSILENFDNEMLAAEKATNNLVAIKPDPTVNKLERQSSSGMITPKPNSSEQPNPHIADMKESLSSHPAMN